MLQVLGGTAGILFSHMKSDDDPIFNRDIDGYMDLEFRGKVPAGEVNWGVISM